MADEVSRFVNVTVGERIRALRVAKGWTQQELGEKLGVQNAAVHKYEKGLVVNLKRETVAKMAELFGVSPAYIMGFSGEGMTAADIRPIGEMKRHKIPVIGSVAAGVPIVAEQEYDVYTDPGTDIPADFALTVCGHSMEPTYLDGDVIYIRACPDVRDGQIAVVLIDDSATLKHVYHDVNGVTLVSDNPAYAPMRFDPHNSDLVRILGTVAGFTRMYK